MISEKKMSPVTGMLVIRNARGLHTRPSTEVVKCAVGFKADVKLYYQRCEANAKSLLSVVMLAASKGARIRIKATGEDAAQAVESLIQLAQNNFNISY